MSLNNSHENFLKVKVHIPNSNIDLSKAKWNLFFFQKETFDLFFPHWNHIKYATELQTELQEIENTHESFLISENGKNGEASWKAGFPQHTFLHIERILIVRKNHSELRNQAGRWLCPADYFAGLVWWCNLGLL